MLGHIVPLALVATMLVSCAAHAGLIPPPVAEATLLLDVSEPFSEVPSQYRNLRRVTVATDIIRRPAQRIRVNLPGIPEVSVPLVRWKPRAGYIQVYNDDDPLRPISIPDPSARPEDLSWRWYGRQGDVVVGLTVDRGIVAGRVWVGARHFDLAPRPSGTLLGETRSEYWRTHADRPMTGSESNATVPAAAMGRRQRGAAPPDIDGTGWDYQCQGPLPSGYSVVDVLVLYTEGVLAQNEGSHAHAQAAIRRELDETNDVLANSGINSFQFYLRGPEFYPNSSTLDSSPIEQAHAATSGLQWVPPNCVSSPSPTYAQLRREHWKADIVALARRDQVGEGTCGKAFIHNRTFNYDCPHEVGEGFRDFAYLVFNPDCGPDRLNFAHELGHQLGMEHDPRNSVGFVFGGSDPSCPWSFGHRRWDVPAEFRFRSTMAYWEPGSGFVGPPGCFFNEECPQIDAFSTPLVEWGGAAGLQPVGTVGGAPAIGLNTGPPPAPPARAVDTLQRLAPVVAAFWDRGDLIFADGFQ